ncbi:MAG: heme-binding protein, partial [Bdellovibrionales bacterium]|nr:heme-binding protein [Bdellovibrionales bacterium]
MKKILNLKWALLGLVFLGKAGAAMAVSEPRYQVEKKADQYEIRVYPSIIVAQTQVQEKFEDAGNSAFRILADYIFGNNNSKTKIAMTAPVTQQNLSEKVLGSKSMNLTETPEGYLVQFTMPEEYSMATLPQPTDSRVSL